MNWNDVIEKAKNSALEEIEKFGSPPRESFLISLDKAITIANNKSANVNIVALGSILADYKLGQALSEKKLAEHVKISASAARVLLVGLDISPVDIEKVISCVEQHHWPSGWSSLESEIVANADCYRFLTPEGVVAFIKLLSQRNMETKDIINYVLQKAEEKWNILSLTECKKELEQNYIALIQFKNLLLKFPEFRYISDPILRTPTQLVETGEGIEIGHKLGEILVRYRKFVGYGRGLAAPQIGISKSVFVTYLDGQVQTYINPKIVNLSDKKNYYRELCLSCGFLWGDIKRASKITMNWTDENGKAQEKEADGVLARLWQHECQHLEGELNLDFAKPGSIEFVTSDPLQEKLRDSR